MSIPHTLFLLLGMGLTLASCQNDSGSKQSNNKNPITPTVYKITKKQLLDRIKGGWAGQTIGCTFGGPTEFRYNGTIIQDYVPIKWEEGQIKWYYDHQPGLYDDVYMDLTFVEVFDRLGLDAPTDSFAMAFATAGYTLWHANQAARYNILNGIMPPESGHWLNNPHANDIDYQIEADFAGLMSPGMPNAASEISDRIGHIMNYGDGWYGGVFIGAMYSLACVSDDLGYIVSEALKTIPPETVFYQCINDVINWHKQHPDDWKEAWFLVERKYAQEHGCPDGVFTPFNIDATINSAYVVIGLLYGQGNFFHTLNITTRCGQDSDCNPASAAGILGTMIGYSNIPVYWMKNLRIVEDIHFAYTNLSLNKTYEMSFNQALQMVERNGGSINGEEITIARQTPQSVQFEESFKGHFPIDKKQIGGTIRAFKELSFEGIGIVLSGHVQSKDDKYIAEIEVRIDDQKADTIKMPASYTTRRTELYWKYQLENKIHTLSLKWLNPNKKAEIHVGDALIYNDTPTPPMHPVQ